MAHLPEIYVDADACPVKDEVMRVAERHNLAVHMVANAWMRHGTHPGVNFVIVAEGADAADDWIAAHIGTGDIVVTADIPLAARCVDAGASVLKPDGSEISAANAGNALAMRDLMTDLRAADPFRQGGGRAFSKADRSRFRDALERILRRAD